MRLLIAAETPEIRVSFIEPATNRGTMDDKRSGHSCHNQLVAQTHTSLGRQTFCLPETLLKPHSYSRDAAPSYMYMISQFWEGPPVCTAQGPRQQARVICSPTSWQRLAHAVLVPTTMNAPHILTSLAPQKRPKSDGQHGIHVTTSPRIWIIQQEILGASHFSVRPKFRAIAAAGGAWTEQRPRPAGQ